LIREAGAPASLLAVRPDRTCVWAQFTVFIQHRDAVQKKLQSRGVPTAVHYPVALNRQPAYQHLCCADCTPRSDAAASSVISLPMHPYLTESTQAFIVNALVDALSG
jgi:UDP-2-acetamido-2-deoxy-ribo-hexuluronate aminotransferase